MNDILEKVRSISKKLKKEYMAEKVILFGSYANGKATEESDVDLFIVAPSREKYYRRGAAVRKIVRDLYRGVPLSPIILTQEELTKRLERKDQFIENILHEGVEL